MSEDNYPSEDDLERLEYWKFHKMQDYYDYANFVVSLWDFEDYATLKGRTLKLITGGWSGNEDIIAAINSNILFRAICWEKSERGGLHIYKLPCKEKICKSKPKHR